MDMQELVTEFSQWPSEAGREIAHAAQIILTGKSQQIRDLCKGPWEVQRYEQKNDTCAWTPNKAYPEMGREFYAS